LPDQSQFIPANSDDLHQRMQDAQDASDAMNVLRDLGILPPEE
jgi:hypothetical protein